MNRAVHPSPQLQVSTLVGRLPLDPVLTQLDDDRKVSQLRPAAIGQKDQPMFARVATLGAQADACAKYLTKCRAVVVTDRQVYRKCDDNGTRRSRHHVGERNQFGGKPAEPAAETSDAAREVATLLINDGRRKSNVAGAPCSTETNPRSTADQKATI